MFAFIFSDGFFYYLLFALAGEQNSQKNNAFRNYFYIEFHIPKMNFESY